MQKSDNENISRKRTFATIVYPDSAPDNWRNILSDSHVPALVSPLHSKDLFETGEPKKPHYHVLVYLQGKKTLEWVTEFFQSFGGVGLEIVNSKSGYTRYLCHLDEDSANKPRYNPSDVRAFGGANFEKWAELDNDPMLYLGDIMDFIEDHNIYSFYELVRYCQKYEPNWHRLLATRCTVFMKEYLKSRKWEESRVDGIEEIIDNWHNGRNEEKEVVQADGRLKISIE